MTGHGGLRPFGGAALVGIVFLALGLMAHFPLGCLAVVPRAVVVQREAARHRVELSEAMREQVRAAFARLPLAFILNVGQTDPRVRFYTPGVHTRFGFAAQEVLLAFAEETPRTDRRATRVPIGPHTWMVHKPEPVARGVTLVLRFPGANPRTEPQGEREGAGKIHCLLGRDPAWWRAGLPAYGEIRYRELWPGVDLRLRGRSGRLQVALALQPGASLPNIRLAYGGAAALSLDAGGNLQIETVLGVLKQERPRGYQEIGSEQVPVEIRFMLERQVPGERAFGFAVGGGYDRRHPLVIETGVDDAAFRGGASGEHASGIAVDAAGGAYLTGSTGSVGFPAAPGPFERPLRSTLDAFVAKLDAGGLCYATYLGGGSNDAGFDLAVNARGEVSLAGSTRSRDFATTPGAWDRSYNGGWDTFVARLDATGARLLSATYLGGSGQESVTSLTVDPAGPVYVTGITDSPDFPTAPRPFMYRGGQAFVAKLDAATAGLLYCDTVGP